MSCCCADPQFVAEHFTCQEDRASPVQEWAVRVVLVFLLQAGDVRREGGAPAVVVA